MTKPFSPAHAHRYPVVIGCDEAGRGALCGPVVAAAVWFEPTALAPDLLGALDDSKRLSAKQREGLAAEIVRVARVAIAAGSAAQIDRRNIRTMSLDAMQRAVRRLGLVAPVLVDGVDVPPGIELPCESVVRGDATVPQIAAASIIAKTFRDRLMTCLAARHPGYGWAQNAGYGTARHLTALMKLGPTRHHRLSFGPVAEARLRHERRTARLRRAMSRDRWPIESRPLKEVIARATAAFGTRSSALAWLDSRSARLGSMRPIDLLSTGLLADLELIRGELSRIEGSAD